MSEPVGAPRRDRPAVAVVLAGGVGTRMGGSIPKQLMQLAGRPVLDYALAAFAEAPGIDRVVLVMAQAFRAPAERLAGRYPKVTDILDGGANRTASTRAALNALRAEDGDLDVLVHDAARPLVTQRTIADCLAALASGCAVTAAIPTADTILQVDPGVDGGTIAAIPDRSRLLRCQTPQGFRLATLRQAYARAEAQAGPDLVATDDCAVVLRFCPEVSIRVVPGSAGNLKVTEPADLDLAEALLRSGL